MMSIKIMPKYFYPELMESAPTDMDELAKVEYVDIITYWYLKTHVKRIPRLLRRLKHDENLFRHPIKIGHLRNVMVLRFSEAQVKEQAVQFNKFRERSTPQFQKLKNIYRSYAVQLSDSEHILEALLKVQVAYCMIKKVEYQQGLHEIALPFVLQEDRDFSLAKVYGHICLFIQNFIPNLLHSRIIRSGKELIHLTGSINIFKLLLSYHDKPLYLAMIENQELFGLFMTAWFLAMFARLMDVPLLLELWQIIMIENDVLFPYFFSVALIMKSREVSGSLLQEMINSVDMESRIAAMKKIRIHNYLMLSQLYHKSILLRSITPRSFRQLVRRSGLFAAEPVESLEELNLLTSSNNFTTMPFYMAEIATPLERLSSISSLSEYSATQFVETTGGNPKMQSLEMIQILQKKRGLYISKNNENIEMRKVLQGLQALKILIDPHLVLGGCISEVFILQIGQTPLKVFKSAKKGERLVLKRDTGQQAKLAPSDAKYEVKATVVTLPGDLHNADDIELFMKKEKLVSEGPELGSHHLVLYKARSGRVEDWQFETVQFYLQNKCYISNLVV